MGQQPRSGHRWPRVAGPDESAIVVEDDSDLQSILEHHLEAVGYHCVSVSSAEDALVEFAARDFEVAVVDVVLPGMSGTDLVAALEGQRTAMSTGFIFTSVVDREQFDPGQSHVVLQKPFRRPEFIAVLRKVLASRRS